MQILSNIQAIHKTRIPAGYAHAAQLNIHSGADIGPSFQSTEEQISMVSAGTLACLAIPKSSIPTEFVLRQVPALLTGLPAKYIHGDVYMS